MSEPRAPRQLLSRLPLVISLLALVVALGGTAVAAGLAKNSVGTKQLKKNAVSAAKIKKNAVTSRAIKDRSVTARDLAAGVLPPHGVDFQHSVAPGTAVAPVTVAGVRFQPTCVAPDASSVASRVRFGSVGGAADLSLSISVNKTVGSTRTADSAVADGIPAVQVEAEASGGQNAGTVVEGIVRSGTGAWLRVTIGMRGDLGGGRTCLLHLVAVPVD